MYVRDRIELLKKDILEEEHATMAVLSETAKMVAELSLNQKNYSNSEKELRITMHGNDMSSGLVGRVRDHKNEIDDIKTNLSELRELPKTMAENFSSIKRDLDATLTSWIIKLVSLYIAGLVIFAGLSAWMAKVIITKALQ
jgi:hypothetical protein